MPPCRIGRPLRPSGPAILLGLCLVTVLRALNWSCMGGANLSKTDDWGAPPPPRGIVLSRMDMIAYPTFDL
jgi:hypothetical protein